MHAAGARHPKLLVLLPRVCVVVVLSSSFVKMLSGHVFLGVRHVFVRRLWPVGLRTEHHTSEHFAQLSVTSWDKMNVHVARPHY